MWPWRSTGLGLFAADGNCISVFGESSDSATCDVGAILLFGGLTGWLVAAPAIHLAEGRPKHSLASVSLRLGLPILLAIAGDELGGDDDDDLSGVGALTGIGAAMLIDALVLARRDRPRRQSASVLPSLSPTRGGATAGVVGTF